MKGARILIVLVTLIIILVVGGYLLGCLGYRYYVTRIKSLESKNLVLKTEMADLRESIKKFGVLMEDFSESNENMRQGLLSKISDTEDKIGEWRSEYSQFLADVNSRIDGLKAALDEQIHNIGQDVDLGEISVEKEISAGIPGQTDTQYPPAQQEIGED